MKVIVILALKFCIDSFNFDLLRKETAKGCRTICIPGQQFNRMPKPLKILNPFRKSPNHN